MGNGILIWFPARTGESQREVLTCHRCKLMQFRGQDSKCRRCKADLDKKSTEGRKTKNVVRRHLSPTL